MKLYRIYQDKNDDYDTYDSAIVVANSPEEARRIHPATHVHYKWTGKVWRSDNGVEDGEFHCSWTEPEHVGVVEIGEARDDIVHTFGVVLASFNAG